MTGIETSSRAKVTGTIATWSAVGRSLAVMAAVVTVMAAASRVEGSADPGARFPLAGPPTIYLYQPTGTQGGNITVSFLIQDSEKDTVGLLAEFSIDGGSNWSAATITTAGDSAAIDSTGYAGSLTWASATDLAGQHLYSVEFRLTPHDAAVGTAETTYFDVDNQVPQSVTAQGYSGDNTIDFWFDEPVTEGSATTTGNISLDGGLTASSISVNEVWTADAVTVPTYRRDVGVGELDGVIYVIGGWDKDNNELNTAESYDPDTGNWTTLTVLPAVTSYPIVLGLDGLLYVLAGNNIGNTMYIYNPAADTAADTWSNVSTPNFRRSWEGSPGGGSQGGVINGKLYVNDMDIGMQIYDPATDSWSSDPVGVTTQGPATAVIDGKMYLAGGDNWANQLSVYDPVAGTMSALALMTTARRHAVGGTLDGKFYVIGGNANTGDVGLVEIYDPIANSWSSGTQAPTASQEYTGVQVGQTIYFGREISSFGFPQVVFDTYTRNSYELTLASGTLPVPPTTVSFTGNNISDRFGNSTSSLNDVFAPATGNSPAISVYGPTGLQGGNVAISYAVTDDEDNPVWLLAQYQLDGSSTWNAATVTGDTTEVPSGSYAGSLTWASATDLNSQEQDRVTFRITVRDTSQWGGSDTTILDIDNLAPTTVTGQGNAGDGRFSLTFNEPVTQASATSAGNYSFSGGLTVGSVSSVRAWTGDDISAPTLRRGAGVVVLEDKLYVIGGNDNGTHLTVVEVYDPSSSSWSTAASMPTAREHPVVAAMDGTIFVIGGNGSSGNYSTVEVYDPETNRWTSKGNAPFTDTANNGIHGEAINGKIYISHAWDGMYIYDPVADSWQNVAAGVSRQRVATAALNGKLYLMGGSDNATGNRTNNLSVYDPVAGTTTSLTSMSTIRDEAAADVIDGKIMVVGGHDQFGNSSNSVEIYDPAADSWSSGPNVPFTNGNYQGAVLNGTFYYEWDNWNGSNYEMRFNSYSQNTFEVTLGSSEALPSPPDSLTITASGISDWTGNTASSLVGSFTAATGQAPTISVTPVTGIQSGNITVSYEVEDAENNPVDILAEFQLAGSATWTAASVTGTTSGIDSTAYQGSLTWDTATDIANQEGIVATLRVSVRDDGGSWTSSGLAVFEIDNRSPQSMSAEGTGGSSTMTFWFNEPAAEATATDTSKISLSDGLDDAGITVLEEWTPDHTAPTVSRQQAGVAVLFGIVYVVGGQDNAGNDVATVEAYDPSTGTWSTKASMPTARRQPAATVALDGKLYVFGGYSNAQGGHNTIEVYDPETNSWSSKNPMPFNDHWDSARGGVVNGKLYLNYRNLNQLHSYDPGSDSWQTHAQATPYNQTATAVVGGKLYFIGGNDPNTNQHRDEVFVFDPATGNSTALSSMPTRRGMATAGVIDGRIYVVGGQTDSGPTAVMEIYDPATDQWATGVSALQSYGGIDGAVVGGELWYGHADSGTGNSLVYDVYSRNRFELTLAGGLTLPSPPATVTVTAAGITDRAGNLIPTDLVKAFTPSSGQAPDIDIQQPGENSSGDITISYLITDQESNPVWMLAEYQLPGGSTWYPASVTGDTTQIPSSAYDGTIVWNSASDLPGQEVAEATFRLTIRDNGTTWGGSGSTAVDVDNLAPLSIIADGMGGGASIMFWFNEAVTEASATNTSNFSLSGGLTVAGLSVLEEWQTEVTESPGYRRDAGVAALNGEIYVVGGHDNTNNLSRVDSYNPVTSTWTTRAQMPTARENALVVASEGKLYAIGGYTDFNGNLNTVEVYDPGSNSWTTKNPAPFNEQFEQGINGDAIGGKIYVSHAYSSVYEYDPVSDSWQNLGGGLNNERIAASAVGGKLYLAGGWDTGSASSSNEVKVFDPSTGVTSSLANMPTARTDAVGVGLNGRFYVIGGYFNGGSSSKSVEVFNPATGQWSTALSTINTGGGSDRGAAVDGKLYYGWDMWDDSNNHLKFDVYSRNRYELSVGGGILPSSPDSVIVTAIGITDLAGNSASSIDTTFVPSSGQAPTIKLGHPDGRQSGDITLSYEVSDQESNPVWLLAEYQLSGSSGWVAASVTGDTTLIPSSQYQGSLTWNSTADLPDQVVDRISFRLKIRDNGSVWGGEDGAIIDLDNLAPQTLIASGMSGWNTLEFTFDEQVSESIATDVANFTLSSSLTAGSITPLERWSSMAVTAPTVREEVGIGVLDGRIYLIGGRDGGTDQSTVESYDPDADSWSTHASIPTAQTRPIVGTIDGKLYVTGGWTQNGSTNRLEVYDPVSDSWTSRSSQHFNSGSVGAVINGKWYINESGQGIWEYNPETDVFVNVSAGANTEYGTASVIDGKLYLAGGWHYSYGNYTNEMVVFDPVTRVTTQLASMSFQRQRAVAGVIDGKLYIAGGFENGNSTDELEIYDPATNSWTTGLRALNPSDQGTGISLAGKLYFLSQYWVTGFGNHVSFDIYTRDRYEITLGGGGILPAPPGQVTVTAANITDIYGNVISSDLSDAFTPATGDLPSVAVYPPSEVISGDVTIDYEVTDTENNTIWLLAEYQLSDQTGWHPATISGGIDSISAGSYQGTLTWQSATDLPDQEVFGVRFRLTPWDDPAATGTPGGTRVSVDNRAPVKLNVDGAVGETMFRFWFNEPVTEASATNTASFSMTDGLTVNAITPIEDWAQNRLRVPNPGWDPGIGVLDGKLYIAGGYEDVNYLSKVDVYDPVTDNWTSVSPMPTGRHEPQVVGLNGYLYVIGGNGFNGDERVLEMYDPDTDSWQIKAGPPFGVHTEDFRAAVLGGKIYVNHAYDGMYVYDPGTDQWEWFNGGLQSQSTTLGVIDGKLYIAGGVNTNQWFTTSELAVFDPVNRTTTPLASLPAPRANAIGGVIGGKFILVGGNLDGGDHNTIVVYDPASDSWSTSSLTMPRQSGNPAGVIHGGRAYFGMPEWIGPSQFFEFDIYLRDGFELTLGGGAVLPFARLTLSASGIVDWYGNTASSISTAFVPKDTNVNPTITLTGITGEVTGDVVVSYTITDPEGDNIRLVPEYSTDLEVTWMRATTSADTVNIAPSSYSGTISWFSDTDLSGMDLPDVRFRLTPADNMLEKGDADDISIHVDNNDLPSITFTSSAYSKVDTTWTVNYTLNDTESDTLTLRAEYSQDGGATWLTATTSSAVSGIGAGNYTGTLVWNVERDIPGAVMEVLFRIVPGDIDDGDLEETSVYLNVWGVPTLAIDSTHTDEQNGDITFIFSITDEESDQVGVRAEFKGADLQWHAATVIGDTTLGSVAYTDTLVWQSEAAGDLPNTDMVDCAFRLIPYDAHAGFHDEVSFHLDNNEVPSATITVSTGAHHRDVPIAYILSDTESDVLGISAEYSTDAGTTWNPMTVSGTTSGIGASGYTGQVTWNAFDDLGYGDFTGVLTRIIPNDLDPGAAAISSTLEVKNYTGDYSADGAVGSADFATLIGAYNQQDSYHDIGPASGTPPLLMPTFDGAIDFEDLAVFIQMWNWSLTVAPLRLIDDDQNGLTRPVPDGGSARPVSRLVTLEERIPDDAWAPDSGVLDLDLRGYRLPPTMVTAVEIAYDTEHLDLAGLDSGPLMGRAGGRQPTMIPLTHIDREEGRIYLMLGRIDPEQPVVSGTGILASLHFTKLSEEDSDVTVAFELWNQDADLIVSEIYSTEVHSLRIPGEFALLQNYPNPFNGETIIRFQLPSAQRVRLYIFNIRGQRVATIVDEEMDPGYHQVTWDGRTADNQQVATGIYIYLIQVGTNKASRKLTIIK